MVAAVNSPISAPAAGHEPLVPAAAGREAGGDPVATSFADLLAQLDAALAAAAPPPATPAETPDPAPAASKSPGLSVAVPVPQLSAPNSLPEIDQTPPSDDREGEAPHLADAVPQLPSERQPPAPSTAIPAAPAIEEPCGERSEVPDLRAADCLAPLPSPSPVAQVATTTGTAHAEGIPSAHVLPPSDVRADVAPTVPRPAADPPPGTSPRFEAEKVRPPAPTSAPEAAGKSTPQPPATNLSDPRGQSFLGAEQGTAQDSRTRAAPIAMIFNEHGVISDLYPQTSASPAAPAIAEAADDPSPSEGSKAPLAALLKPFHELLLAGAIDEAMNAFRAAITQISASAAAAPLARASTHRAGPHPHDPRAADPVTPSGPNGGPEEQEEADEVSPRQRTANAPRSPARDDEAGGATVAQLLVEAAEHGLRLVARTGKLSREQRLRLRAEIVQLLAGLGLRTEEIRLNGELIPAREW